MRLFRQRLKNESDQRFVARLYFGLVLALLYRPYADTFLSQTAELTILNTQSLTLIFTAFGFYLRRTRPIHLLEYVVLLVPLAIFSVFVAMSLFTHPEGEVFLVVFIGGLWYKIFRDLRVAVEALP